MYRYSNGQISLADFRQPVGMNLKEGNRWVKKAQTIPWPEIEKRYAALFTNRKGNVAKPDDAGAQRQTQRLGYVPFTIGKQRSAPLFNLRPRARLGRLAPSVSLF